jgi:hypothetical protein
MVSTIRAPKTSEVNQQARPATKQDNTKSGPEIFVPNRQTAVTPTV